MLILVNLSSINKSNPPRDRSEAKSAHGYLINDQSWETQGNQRLYVRHHTASRYGYYD